MAFSVSSTSAQHSAWLSAFRDPAFFPWMTRRGIAVLHSLLGTGLVGIAGWLQDQSGRAASSFFWGVWGLLVACWMTALLPQRRSVTDLRRSPALPIPRTGQVVLLGLGLFEIASFSTLKIPHGGDIPVHIIMLFDNLGTAIWVALSGLCFLVLRIPFSWKLWLGAVAGMTACLIGFFFAVLGLCFSGG
jgi:hypothetical protein